MRAQIVALITVSIATACYAVEPVPVVNHSFEDAAGEAPVAAGDWETEGSPPGWHHWIGSTARPGNPALVWEKTGGRTGDRCVSLTRAIGPVCVIQSVPVLAGETYVVRAWGKTTNPKSSCHFSVRWRDAEAKWTGGTLRDNLPDTTPAGEWGEIEVAGTAPDGAAELVILLTADAQSGEDVSWFDDVSVDHLGPRDIVVSPCGWASLLNPEGDAPETPHVKWAKPWASGKLCVLFILGSDHSLREHIEIAQRMDIEYDYAFAHEYDDVLYSLDNKQIMRRLDEGWYDVVVAATGIDGDTCGGLLDRVGPDGGLVLVAAPNIKPGVSDEIALSAAGVDHCLMRSAGALPVVNDQGGTALADISLSEDAPGRLVRLAWDRKTNCLTPSHSYEEDLRWGADYQEGYLQTVIRAVLWAGHKEPAAPATMVAAATGATLVASGGQAHVRVTDRLGRVHGEAAIAVLGQPVEVASPPAAASGPAMFSAIITDADGRVLDFASCRAAVPREASITRVRSAKDWFDEGETVQIVVETAGTVAGMDIEVVMTDIYGRENARATVSAQADETSVDLPMRDHLSTVNWVHARLLDAAAERDAARWYVLAPIAREPFLEDFQMGTWTCTTYHPGYLHDAFTASMRRAGITLGLDSPNAYLPDLAGGVWPVSTAYGKAPGFSRFAGPDTERTPCLSDPEIRQRTIEAIGEVATDELGWRPIFGYIRDETSLVADALALDTCSSVHCQTRYREWLRERYETIAELNAEWGTAHQSWDDAGFTTFGEAREAGNLAPWVMYRRFMDWVWADGVSLVCDAARRVDPTSMSALANSFGQAPFSGRDYELLASANQYTMEYPSECMNTSPLSAHYEAVRSLPPAAVHHPWIGYRHVAEALSYEPWWCALHGSSGVSVYGAMSVFVGKNSWAQIFPTLQLTERGRIFADVCRPLQEGLGKALMGAKRPPADIAMLWSQPSLYAAWGLSEGDTIADVRGGINPYHQYFFSRDAFRKAIISGGRQFDYVTESGIADGALDGRRCLVLPGSFALDTTACEAIRSFVEGGGLLIADQGAGLLNGAGGRWLGASPVADLLGITRTGDGLSYEKATVTCDLPGGVRMNAEALGHEALASVGGVPAYADGSPMVVARQLGAGRTIFLNAAFDDFAGLRGLFEGMPGGPAGSRRGALLRDSERLPAGRRGRRPHYGAASRRGRTASVQRSRRH